MLRSIDDYHNKISKWLTAENTLQIVHTVFSYIGNRRQQNRQIGELLENLAQFEMVTTNKNEMRPTNENINIGSEVPSRMKRMGERCIASS